MKYFLIAGEPSGDMLGKKLIQAIKAQDPNAEIIGIGGPLMIEAGLTCLLDMDELNVMGIWEVLLRLRQLKKIMQGVVDEIELFNPDALITIDFPDFTFHVARQIKKRGKTNAKLIHYVAPSVWAWRPGRAKKIAQFLDAIICLLPMEPPYFKKHGLRSIFVGNPILEDKPDQGDGEEYRNRCDIPEGTKVVGMFFGSRPQEIKKLSPIMIETATYLKEKYGDNLMLIAPTLPNLEFDILQILSKCKVPSYVAKEPHDKWNAFAACDVAIAVSGTVALELAYANIPHVVLYKTHPLTFIIAKILAKIKYIHLANIIADEAIVPEFIQGNCKSELISMQVIKLLEDRETAGEQKEKFLRVKEALGNKQDDMPSDKAAKYIMNILVGGKKSRAAPKPQKAEQTNEGLPPTEKAAQSSKNPKQPT